MRGNAGDEFGQIGERTKPGPKKGYQHTPEHRESNRRAALLRRHTDEERRKMSAAITALRQWETPEFREMLARRSADPVWRAKNAAVNRGRRASEETRAKLRARPRVPHSAETRQRMSEQRRRWWAARTPDQVAAHVKPGLDATPSKNTSIELLVQEALRRDGVSFETGRRFGRYFVDVFVPAYALAIEVDGEYWHAQPKAVARDQRKDAYLTSIGLRVLRIPGRQAATWAWSDFQRGTDG